MDLLFFYKFMIWLDQDSKGARLNRGNMIGELNLYFWIQFI